MTLTPMNGLVLGETYDRNELSRLWGYQGHQAISKGVVTPRGSGNIVLFVTVEKQAMLTQYSDFMEDCWLHWEGEKGHGTDKRLIAAEKNGEKIHLLFREKHHSDFHYYGEVFLRYADLHRDSPSEFIFFVPYLDTLKTVADGDRSPGANATTASTQELLTERASTGSIRIGQGIFRMRVIRRFRGHCAVTGCGLLPALRASHIKPWALSSSEERLSPANGLLLTPNLDSLFDRGFIAFDKDGQIIVSAQVKSEDSAMLIPPSERGLTVVHRDSLEYLEYHRKHVFDSARA